MKTSFLWRGTAIAVASLMFLTGLAHAAPSGPLSYKLPEDDGKNLSVSEMAGLTARESTSEAFLDIRSGARQSGSQISSLLSTVISIVIVVWLYRELGLLPDKEEPAPPPEPAPEPPALGFTF
jgi:hypothetical protein